MVSRVKKGHPMRSTRLLPFLTVTICVSAMGVATLQVPAAPPPPAFTSPDVQPDRRVVFRIFAPRADEVRLVGTDIPRNVQGIAMTKDNRGGWGATVGPLDPG